MSPAEEPSLHPPKKVYPETQRLQNRLSRFNLSILSPYSLKSKGQDCLYQPPQPLPPTPNKKLKETYCRAANHVFDRSIRHVSRR
jgi:hypothetical protein